MVECEHKKTREEQKRGENKYKVCVDCGKVLDVLELAE